MCFILPIEMYLVLVTLTDVCTEIRFFCTLYYIYSMS